MEQPVPIAAELNLPVTDLGEYIVKERNFFLADALSFKGGTQKTPVDRAALVQMRGQLKADITDLDATDQVTAHQVMNESGQTMGYVVDVPVDVAGGSYIQRTKYDSDGAVMTRCQIIRDEKLQPVEVRLEGIHGEVKGSFAVEDGHVLEQFNFQYVGCPGTEATFDAEGRCSSLIRTDWGPLQGEDGKHEVISQYHDTTLETTPGGDRIVSFSETGNGVSTEGKATCNSFNEIVSEEFTITGLPEGKVQGVGFRKYDKNGQCVSTEFRYTRASDGKTKIERAFFDRRRTDEGTVADTRKTTVDYDGTAFSEIKSQTEDLPQPNYVIAVKKDSSGTEVYRDETYWHYVRNPYHPGQRLLLEGSKQTVTEQGQTPQVINRDVDGRVIQK